MRSWTAGSASGWSWAISPAAIRAAWRQAGITHLLVYRQGMRFLLEAADPHHPPADLAGAGPVFKYPARAGRLWRGVCVILGGIGDCMPSSPNFYLGRIFDHRNRQDDRPAAAVRPG